MKGRVFGTWHVGRKEIIAYLRPFIKLPQNPAYAWQKVKRWRRRYCLPIEIQLNGKPYIDEVFFHIFTSGSGNSDRSISEDLALKRPMNYGQGKEQVDEKDKKESLGKFQGESGINSSQG